MIEVALPALGMGLVASVHCFAMCGPLVAAGACSKGVVNRRDAAGYFGARLVAYATVGAILGHLGKHALCILPTGTIATAAAIVVAAFAFGRGIAAFRAPTDAQTIPLGRGPRRPTGTFASFFASLLPRRGAALGAATAILPCGVLLPAWALAASSASALGGAMTMAVFALASAPGLVLALVGQRLASRAVALIPRRAAAGVGWILLAVWIAARPLLVAAHACH